MTDVLRAWLWLAVRWPTLYPFYKEDPGSVIAFIIWIILSVLFLFGVPMLLPFVIVLEGIIRLLRAPRYISERLYFGTPEFKRNDKKEIIARIGNRKPIFYAGYYRINKYGDEVFLWRGVDSESYMENYLNRCMKGFLLEEERTESEAQYSSLFNSEMSSAGLLSLADEQ